MNDQSPRFTHHSDGVVFEPARDLHWTAEDVTENAVSYDDGVKAIERLNEQAFGGFNDWRMPEVEELFLLADRTKFDPAIDTDFFPNCKSSWYRTATADAEDPSEYAWVVYFDNGNSCLDFRGGGDRVRAVRGPCHFDQAAVGQGANPSFESYCSEERSCTPCFSDDGPCEDADAERCSPASSADSPLSAVRRRFESSVSAMTPAEYTNGYREALEHVDAAIAQQPVRGGGLSASARYWRERAEFWRAQAVSLGWREKRDAEEVIVQPKTEPVQMELNCPKCKQRHIDEGEWKTRVHRTHQCQHCGHEWRPFDYPTVGVPAQPRTEQAAGEASGESPMPMESAPRDGTMLRLLVEFDDHATEDVDGSAWTIGANNFDNDGDDEWLFAGWCWTHDHFTQGTGRPVGWLPMLAVAPTPHGGEGK